MRRMLPNVTELSVLATLAVLAAVVLLTMDSHTVLPVVAFPVLITSMLMGARRTGHLAPVRKPVSPTRAVKEPA